MAERRIDDSRQCPTRPNGAHSLIAQWITPATCVTRQRQNYHKCFTCEYRGVGANAPLPVPVSARNTVVHNTAPKKTPAKSAVKVAPKPRPKSSKTS